MYFRETLIMTISVLKKSLEIVLHAQQGQGRRINLLFSDLEKGFCNPFYLPPVGESAREEVGSRGERRRRKKRTERRRRKKRERRRKKRMRRYHQMVSSSTRRSFVLLL